MTEANIAEKNMHTPPQRVVSKNTKIIIIVNYTGAQKEKLILKYINMKVIGFFLLVFQM